MRRIYLTLVVLAMLMADTLKAQVIVGRNLSQLEMDNVTLAKDKIYLVNLKSASINQTIKLIK